MFQMFNNYINLVFPGKVTIIRKRGKKEKFSLIIIMTSSVLKYDGLKKKE